MAAHRALPAEHDRHAIGVGHGNQVRVEAEPLIPAVFLGRRHLHRQRLRRDLERADGDAVVRADILDGLDVWIVGKQQDWATGQRGHDPHLGFGFIPQHEGRTEPAHREVRIAGEDQVAAGRAARHVHERHLDLAQARRFGVLLDQAAIDRDVDGQIAQTVGHHDPDFVRFRHCVEWQQSKQGEQQALHGCSSVLTILRATRSSMAVLSNPASARISRVC